MFQFYCLCYHLTVTYMEVLRDTVQPVRGIPDAVRRFAPLPGTVYLECTGVRKYSKYQKFIFEKKVLYQEKVLFPPARPPSRRRWGTELKLSFSRPNLVLLNCVGF